MELTHIQHELTAAYIRGELTGTALANFETMLNENEALRKEVMLQKTLMSALHLNMVEATMKQAKADSLLEDTTQHPQFETIRSSMQQARVQNNRQTRIRRWLVTGVAVACILFIGIFGLQVSHLSSKIETEIASLQLDFEISNPKYEYVSSTSDVEENVQNAKKLYDKGKLAEAAATLNLIPEKEASERILLTKGKIQAQLKNYKESCRILRIITTDMNIDKRDGGDINKVKDEAHLVLGMIYLRNWEKKKAKEQLEQIHTISVKKEADRIMKTYF